jgi:hypothetical protein
MVKLKDMREGSVVYVRGAFGGGSLNKATVVAVCEDVKNGHPGIDYELSDGDGYWAYLEQVDRVVKY